MQSKRVVHQQPIYRLRKLTLTKTAVLLRAKNNISSGFYGGRSSAA
jgi:hypothetical protein